MNRTYPLAIRWAASVALLLLPVFNSAIAADLLTPAEFVPLTADQRGVKAGDIVTIVVVENSSASNSADISTDKNYSLSYDLQTLKPRREGLQASVGDQLDGRGRVSRSGRMVAQLSVRVQEVYPNGDLLVRGEQELNLNGEKTRISIEGRLRARDISDGNVALSSRLADARIEYVGDGYLAERTRPGLIPRIFSWLGLW
jgi:flagellar L-ring protein precursor FlgH